MSSLIRSLHMHIDEVVCLQCLDGSLCLAFVVRVPQACGSRHINHPQSCQGADATNQIHCRDDCSSLNLRERLGEWHHVGTIPSCPRPDAVCLTLTTLCLLHVVRMLGQQLLRTENQVIQQVCRLLRRHSILLTLPLGGVGGGYKQWFPRLARMVVWRLAYHMLVATLNDQQMTVLYATIELHTLCSKMLVEVVNQHPCILCLQVAPIVRDDVSVLQRDDVATDGHIVGSQVHTDAGSLQWATAFIHLILVITENAAVRHLTARMEPVLHRLQHAATSHLCQLVHVGYVGILQQRLISQRLHRPVSHSVA